MESTACGRRLARSLPGHLQGSQRSPPEWKQQGQNSVESKRGEGEGRRTLRSDQRANRDAVQQDCSE